MEISVFIDLFIYLFILAELSICVSNLVLLGGGLRISVNLNRTSKFQSRRFLGLNSKIPPISQC